MMDGFSGHFNYWVFAVLLMIGLYGMVAKRNLIKKVIGLSIFQTAIILFYLSISAKRQGRIPIIPHVAGDHHKLIEVDPILFDNPLPHVLMLTAIVVGVATLGLALTLAQRIYREYGTLEEDELLAILEKEPEND